MKKWWNKLSTDVKLTMLVVSGLLFICAMLMTGCLAFDWYRAGQQAQVYQREGIEITQWEVFMKAKPAERSINLKDSHSKDR